MNLKVSYKQNLIMAAKEPRVLVVGAVGSAKSSTLALFIAILIGRYPGIPILCSRADMADFKKTTMVEIKKFLPKSWIASWNHQEGIVKFKDGSSLIYPELKDWSSLKSLTLGAVLIDEADEVPYDTYKILVSRLRWRNENGQKPKYKVMMMCNAEPFWGRDIFRDHRLPGIDGRALSKEAIARHKLIYSRIEDNPFLPEDYEENLRQEMPQSWIRKYIDLDWDSSKGRVWPEWKDVRVVDRMTRWKVKKQEVSGITLDHGRVHPTVVLFWIFDPYEPHLYIYDEYWMVQKYPDDHAKEIWRILGGRRPDILVADSAIFADVGKDKDMPSIADEYANNNLLFERASKRAEDQITRAGMWMKNHRITIAKTCVHTIRECDEWAFDRKTNKPRDVEDDCCDCVKYTIEVIEETEMPKHEEMAREYRNKQNQLAGMTRKMPWESNKATEDEWYAA